MRTLQDVNSTAVARARSFVVVANICLRSHKRTRYYEVRARAVVVFNNGGFEEIDLGKLAVPNRREVETALEDALRAVFTNVDQAKADDELKIYERDVDRVTALEWF